MVATATSWLKTSCPLRALHGGQEGILTVDTGQTRALTCGGIELDEATHEVWRDGQTVTLSPTEYRLLYYLLQNAGVVVSRAQILEHVWGSDETGDGVVDTFMSTLRRKVDPTDARVIRTVRGFGYIARAEP